MNDPGIASSERLVAALRSNEPDALAALFDAYAARLFRYCWFTLRNTDIAQIALRDTLAAAAAHAGRLADPAQLSSWLYALARAECRRRRPVPPADADEPPARPSQPDADSRLMAWNAVTSMDRGAMELLDLACRHDVDLGLVLGTPALDIGAMLDQARQDLERALGAEILVSRGSHACPDRAEVMRGWAGTMTPALRERVLRHAAACPVCGPSLPRGVSAARVFALLPLVCLPADARSRVLAFAADPAAAPYRDFATRRAGTLDPTGFPHPVGSEASAFPNRLNRPDRNLNPRANRPTVDSTRPNGDPTRERTTEAAASTLPNAHHRIPQTTVVPHGERQQPSGSLTSTTAPTDHSGESVTASNHRQAGGLGGVVFTPQKILTAAVLAAAVASILLVGLGGTSPGRENSASGGAAASASGHGGAGAVGALPVNANPRQGPTALPSAPHSTATSNLTLFTTLTKPMPSPTRQGPGSGPLPPPRDPGTVVSASPSPASSGRGSLTVSPGSIDLGAGSQAQIVLTAVGGQQTWTAGTSTTALLVSGYGGVLQAGQSVTLLVTVNRQGDEGGNGLVYIDQGMPGTQTVKVSWSGNPPTPSPTPTPVQSSSPTPSGSPSPPTSSGSSSPSESPSASAVPSARPSEVPSYRHTPPPRPFPTGGSHPPGPPWPPGGSHSPGPRWPSPSTAPSAPPSRAPTPSPTPSPGASPSGSRAAAPPPSSTVHR